MKLAIVTPSTGKVSLGQRCMTEDLKLMCFERGVEMLHFDNTLANELHQSRNLLLYRIYNELCAEDWALWLDSDVHYNPRLIIDKMHRSEEIIARAYPIKPYQDNEPLWCATPVLQNMKHLFWNEDKTLVRAVSFGFGAVMMRQTVATKLAEKCGIIGKGAPRGIQKCIPAFDLYTTSYGARAGDDGSFCLRAQELELDLWLAPDGFVQNGNHGGVYLDFLKEKYGLPPGLNVAGSPLAEGL